MEESTKMALYLITYDLNEEKDYDSLFKKLKEYGTYSHSLSSVWFIETEEDATQIRDKLVTELDEDDELLVIEVRRHWASRNLRKGATDWLKNRF